MTIANPEQFYFACDESRLQELTRTVLQRCDDLATFSEQEGCILRTFLSPVMEQCNEQVRVWMEAAGMRVHRDTGGNLRGILPAGEVNAPTLIFASHLDTVPNAGKYDGILGVMLAISLVDAVHKHRLPFSIEIIGFSDEEGVRFGMPFIGSRAVTGTLRSEDLRCLDANGISLGAAFNAFRQKHPEAVIADLPRGAAGCLEFHIEQGPILENADIPLAVVDAIAGQSRATITFRGRAGHAGTTPMSLRHDALTAAAEWLLFVEGSAADTPGVVATCGRIVCEPGASNIIPGVVRCTLDVRSSSDEVRLKFLSASLEAASRISTRRQLLASYTTDYAQASVALHASLSSLVAECIPVEERLAAPIVSGAGHDSMILAPYLPTAMIFLRSPGGVSHNPEEAVVPGDVVAALRTGLCFLDRFSHWVGVHGDRKQVAACTT